MLYECVETISAPLAPETPVILATGPFNATPATEGGRVAVIFRSPATGTLELSNAGGHFGPAPKCAGYDMLVITGKAGKPVWLRIEDSRVSLETAEHLWGKLVLAPKPR